MEEQLVGVFPSTDKGEECQSPALAAARSGPGWAGAVIMSLAVSAVVTVISIYVYDARYAQKIVSIDIKGYTQAQGRDFLSGKITEEQFRKKFDHLQAVVESIPPNKAVLMGDLVVRNVEVVKP